MRLKDRVWFKYKSSNVRAAVTKLPEHDVPEVFVDDALHGRWWIGAAGIRRDDSPQHDFYARLVNEAETAAKKRRSKGIENSDPTYTGHLLPGEWDHKRWVLESATRWANGMKRAVEPTDVPGIQPASGELVWSAILTEEVCALIYDQDPGVEVDDQQ